MNEWISVKDKEPNEQVIVKVKLDDGTENLGFIDDNYQRRCWLTKGSGGLYWRSFIRSVTHWIPITT